jgi:hypothetical protein
MPKVRTTLTIDDEVMRAVKVIAARKGKGDSEIIEESLRRDLGLDIRKELWAVSQMPADEAMTLALEAQHASRPHRKG